MSFQGSFQRPKSIFHNSNICDYHARNAAWVGKSKMAYRDEIDDAFDAVVFLEEK